MHTSSTLCVLSLAFLCLFFAHVEGAGRPVAHWDAVPFQLKSTPFNVGIVAFHISGVKVQMNVGSQVITIPDPTYNSESNVWEFWTTIDPSNYPDGLVTFNATCVPYDSPASPSYEMPGFQWYANSKNSLTVTDTVYVDSVHGNDTAAGTVSAPVKTLAKAVALNKAGGGGTVYLQKGTYWPGKMNQYVTAINNNYWTLITPAPGVAREDVQISGDARPFFGKMHFANVSFVADFPYNNSLTPQQNYHQMLYGEKNYVWLDNCETRSVQDPATCGVDLAAKYVKIT